MNMICKSWLPQGALGGTVERVLGEAVSAWSQKWLARRLLRPLGGPVALELGGLETGADGYLRSLDDGLSVACDGAARLAIASMLLAAPVEEATLKPADRDYLADLASGCLDDLCEEVARAFGLGSGPPWRSGAPAGLPAAEASVVTFGPSAGEPLLRICVDRDLEVALVKSRAPKAAKPEPLRPLATGLARQPVAVSALLGRCDLSLADLSGLSAGDVLVLDRPLDKPLEVAVDGAIGSARCTVESGDDRLALKILTPFS